MSEKDEEILKKMQDMIRKKKQCSDEDSILTLDDGTELKVKYEQDH